MQQGLLPAVSQRVNRMCQEVPKEYGVSHGDYAQLVRGEAHLLDGLTVAYEHLQRNMFQLLRTHHTPTAKLNQDNTLL